MNSFLLKIRAGGKAIRCPAILLLLIATTSSRAEEPLPLERFRAAQAVNLGDIISSQFVNGAPAKGFRVDDPYSGPAESRVHAWWQSPGRGQAACALRITDASSDRYELRDFSSPELATAAGYRVTHRGRCGSCSGLVDLAVYLARDDLTSPARRCARKWGLGRQKQCLIDSLGLSEPCAESWAYNARHTRQACRSVCTDDYGFFNLLLYRYPGSNTDTDGRLRPCLQCDEDLSGPGFQYSAGRTRRNSGIVAEIERDPAEISPVDHSVYFD